jgi:hypothetical protein
LRDGLYVLEKERFRVDLLYQPSKFKHELVPRIVRKMGAPLAGKALAGRAAAEQIELGKPGAREQLSSGYFPRVHYVAALTEIQLVSSDGRLVVVERQPHVEPGLQESERASAGAAKRFDACWLIAAAVVAILHG